MMAAAQQLGPTPQYRGSSSLSQLGSADRTQCSPEIHLIGWRFFIALYGCDGLEGLAGASDAGAVCCAVPAPEQGWTQNSCCWQVLPWLGIVETVAQAPGMAVRQWHSMLIQEGGLYLCPHLEGSISPCEPSMGWHRA